ncbi:ankyrin repeat-containing protein ITN1-like [Papaver somniferum]|uniref:ankyrin repeat-containing protein ITN1-like n=1 Tax=Papaver somniferum TaxID=3469 RepID=UPI000E6F49F0|nr:ankyrin repeat-containing protein ITN1-like [Papaver somniferum]
MTDCRVYSHGGNLTLISVSYIMNVYKHKLMHKQAIALLKQMLVGLKNANNLDVTIATLFQNDPDIIKEAIKLGNIEFVRECLKRYGFLVWYNIGDQKMIEMAIAEKNVEIVNLICDCGDVEFEDKITLLSVMDNNDNTILHHAAKLAPSAKLNMISGVALQIQRELQWFKGVERMLKINYKDKRNKEGYTARSIFTKEHKELVKEGEQWMKDTSGSCMLVAALIATVAFAAAFTVPGGNISDSHSSKNGTPVFLGKTSFTVFAVADSFALFSSITSVLMFLDVYTSRYAEMDFLKSLPQKVIIGLTTLFISMAAILVAFCASIFIVIGDMSPQSLILIGLFGCVPVTLFAWLQLPLFYEMVQSTYWGDHFEKHKYIDPRVEKIITKRKRV